MHELSGDVGAGARQSEDQLGVSNDEFIADRRPRATSVDLQRNQPTSPRRSHSKSGEDNTFSESVTSISATLVGALRLVASYTIRNNSDVPIGPLKSAIPVPQSSARIQLLIPGTVQESALPRSKQLN